LYLVHVDESGWPGGKGRHYVLLGLGFPLENGYSVSELGHSLLVRLKSEFGYNLREIKGANVYALLKKEKKLDEYYKILDETSFNLFNIQAFAKTVIVDKREFKTEVLSKLREQIDRSLSNPTVGYLNSLRVSRVRQKVVNYMMNRIYDIVVRAQTLNELMLRIHKELEKRDDIGIMIFDAEADNLVDSAFSLFGYALAKEGLAFGDSVITPTRIKHIALSKSNLDFGIQLADLLANAVYNCLVHGDSEAYSKISILLGGKGFFMLPKTVEGC